MSIISVQHSVMEMYQIQWEYFENQFQAYVAQVNIILTVEKIPAKWTTHLKC